MNFVEWELKKESRDIVGIWIQEYLNSIVLGLGLVVVEYKIGRYLVLILILRAKSGYSDHFSIIGEVGLLFTIIIIKNLLLFHLPTTFAFTIWIMHNIFYGN